MKAFKITQGKGFSVSFENGNRVSVQFGCGNYCDNYDIPEHFSFDMQGEVGKKGSNTAETALIDDCGDFISYDGGDVQGYRSPEQVLELMNFAAGNPVNAKELLAALIYVAKSGKFESFSDESWDIVNNAIDKAKENKAAVA